MVKKVAENSLFEILKIITPGDKILVVLIVVIGIASLFAISRLKQPGDRVIIEVNGQELQRLDLESSQEITVTGPIGNTRIKIDHSTVQVVSSDCPEKICVKTGKIRHAGEIIVCVPNKVVVKIIGKTEHQFDVITQ
ncbi:MAG: NusG domain II-containing protein [bacterium]|jgi:hypothetical protein|nr:NusG domain II-containing protein [bacterium]